MSAESAAPLFKRLPPHAQVVPADCDGVSGEWVRTGTGLDESKVVLFFHGGGYFSLSAAAARPLTWRLSEAARRSVLAIDYALAPENDLPAALADALTTYRWLLADGFRPENVTLAGDSTGGHLALATLLAVRDEGLPLPAAVVAVSPWADLTPDGPRHRGNADTDALYPPRFLAWLARCYTSACDPSDPLISPVNGDYAGTPPMMLVCSDAEALRDDARRVAERARDAGVRVRYDGWPGQVHDFPAFAGLIPEGRQAIIRIGEFLLETDR
jgi:epsilon-lactone hydrolase